MQNLKDLRKMAGFTQEQAAKEFLMTRKTYISYENNSLKENTIKYQYMVNEFLKKLYVDETHGILSISQIKEIVTEVLSNYEVSSCTLFGSYAKSTAKETSDVDLVIITKETGLKWFGMLEDLRENLHKVVEALTLEEVKSSPELLSEILKTGIKIYG